MAEKTKLRIHTIADVRIIRLEMVVGLLAVCCAGLIGYMMWESSKPVPICYATAQVSPGLLMPDEVPEEMLIGLAEQIVLSLYSNTTSTVENAHSRIRRLVHPRMLVSYDAARELERTIMNNNRLSTQMMITNTRVGMSEGRHAARVDGVRRIYAGTIVLREEELGAIIHFQKATPSDMNPWGLLIRKLDFTNPLSAEVDG